MVSGYQMARNCRMKIAEDGRRPFISIVMPVFNNERLLPAAVNSVAGQTFSDWELIIINDGSTDGTSRVADSLAEKDRRIQVLHQANQGIYASYNTGYRLASGEYVFIVNSDDTINPGALQAIHDIAIVDHADIVLFNLSENLCDEDQNILKEDLYKHKNLLENPFSYHNREEVRRAWPYFLAKKLINHQCVYRENIYKAYAYGEQYYGEDVLYNQRIANAISSAAGTPYVVYNWFFYSGEAMNASSGKYYGYEHEMFNAFCMGNRKLLASWGIADSKAMEVIEKERLSLLTNEIRSYLSPQCCLTTEQKLEKILKDAADEVVYGCAVSSGRVEEWESRILSGLRELLVREPLRPDSPYYFVYELLDSLLRYEKDEVDFQKIERAIDHPYNPRHIGKTFFQKLNGK